MAESVDIYVEIITESERAYLVSDNDGENEIWLPKSQLGDITITRQSGERRYLQCEIPLWLAEEKELI